MNQITSLQTPREHRTEDMRLHLINRSYTQSPSTSGCYRPMTRHPTRFSAKFCLNRLVLRMTILINFQAWWWSTFFNTLGKGRGSTLGQCYTPKSGSADRSWRGEPGISMFPDVSVRTDWESSVMSGVSELALHVFDKFVFNNLLINQTSLPNH